MVRHNSVQNTLTLFKRSLTMSKPRLPEKNFQVLPIIQFKKIIVVRKMKELYIKRLS